jgi:hypothetical protein
VKAVDHQEESIVTLKKEQCVVSPLQISFANSTAFGVKRPEEL